MSTSLIPAQPQGSSLVKLDGGLAGFEQKITIEQVDLVQNTTRAEGAEPGKFRSKSSGQHVTELFAIPIGAQTKRVLFPDGEFGANPICRSNDGIVPADSIANPPSQSCKTCKMSSWNAYSAAKRRGAPQSTLQALKPKCDEKLELLFLDKLTFKVLRLNTGGASLKEVKSSIRSIQQEIQSIMDKAAMDEAEAIAAGKEFKPVNIGMYDFMLHIKSHKLVNSSGTFYVLQIKQGRTPFTNEDVRQRFAKMYNNKVTALQEMFTRATDDADQEYVEAQIDQSMPAPAVAGVGGAPEPVIEAGSY